MNFNSFPPLSDSLAFPSPGVMVGEVLVGRGELAILGLHTGMMQGIQGG